MNSVHEDVDIQLAISIANIIRDIGIKEGDTLKFKQLRYIKECIFIGKEVTKEDVLNIK